MFPPAAAVGAGALQLQQAMGVRAVATAHVVLGLAVAAFALYVVALNPADFQPQSGDSLQYRAGGCGATPQQALDMRFGALVMLLTAAAQAAVAGAAWVVAPVFGRGMAQILAFLAHVLGGLNTYILYLVVRGVAAVTLGSCITNDNRFTIGTNHVVFLVTQVLLLVVGIVAALCGV